MIHEIVAAWSTFAAVVLALLVASMPYAISRRKRPRLKLKVGSEHPYSFYLTESVSTTLDGETSVRTYKFRRVRVRVHNMGKEQAENAWLRLVQYSYISHASLEADGRHFMLYESAENLEWDMGLNEVAHCAWAGFAGDLTVSIPAGSYNYASLVKIYTYLIHLTIIHSELAEIYKKDPLLAINGFHCFEILFGADQHKPQKKYIVFEINREQSFFPIEVDDSRLEAFRKVLLNRNG